MKVIFNADDFGLTTGVNEGIAQAHLHGVVNSTTMMVGMGAEQDAVKIATQLPELKVGIHLRFTSGSPLTNGSSLIGDEGFFPRQAEFWQKQDFDLEEVYQEVSSQIAQFKKLGFQLSHIDSHHHAHTHPQLLPVIREIAHQLQVPLRGIGLDSSVWRYHFSDWFYDSNLSMAGLLSHLSQFQSTYDVVEIMCHPSKVDEALSAQSSYTHQRALELDILTSDELKEGLIKNGITVTDYSCLTS